MRYKYYKLSGNYRTALAKLTKFEMPEDRLFSFLKNVLEFIPYKLYDGKADWSSPLKFDKPSFVKITTSHYSKYEEITRKEYDDIIAILKEERLCVTTYPPSEPYHFVKEKSTPTKLYFDVDEEDRYTSEEAYQLEYFKTMGAAYPIPTTIWIENKPIIKVIDPHRYKGYKFMEEESTYERSVYKKIWKFEKKINSTGEK